jgi:hypothetical protein
MRSSGSAELAACDAVMVAAVASQSRLTILRSSLMVASLGEAIRGLSRIVS